MTRNKRLATRLSKDILAITTNIFVLAIICVAIVSVMAINKEARSNSTKALKNCVLEIEKTLTQVEIATESMASIVKTVSDVNDTLGYLTTEVLNLSDAVIDCAMAFDPGEDGTRRRIQMSYYDKGTDRVISRAARDDGFDYPASDWYLAAKLLGKPIWNDPRFDIGGSRELVATYSYPIFSVDSTFAGVLRADISLAWLSETLEKFKPYEKAVTILVGRNASFITHIDRDKILAETIFTSLYGDKKNEKAIKACQKILKGESGIKPIRLYGKNLYCTFTPISNGWSAMSFCSFADFYDSVLRINVMLGLIALLGLIMIFFASRKRISKITMPITEFTYSAINMSKGFFNTHLPEVETQDEIGRLRDSMAYLQKSIGSYLQQLKDTKSSKERFESELSIANAIQMAMLPKNFPDRSVADIYAMVSPAKEVGGDLYFFSIDGDYLTFSVGDVSGKGVSAALFMAITGSLLRATKGQTIDTNLIMNKINNVASDENEYGMFVTLFLARINLKTYEMEFCNCGHNPLIIISPDGKAEYLKAKPNLALGIFHGFEYQNERIQLQKGTRIIAYTDGVTEAETAAKDQFGEDRLLDFATGLLPETSSADAVDNLLKEVRTFTAGNEQNDDITIMNIII